MRSGLHKCGILHKADKVVGLDALFVFCLSRSRNELAETLELLKAQIDPELLKKQQQENSSRESPSIEGEEAKKGEETSTQGFAAIHTLQGIFCISHAQC